MHAILVHGLDDARSALRAAQEAGAPVVLISGPGGAGYGGAAWFDAIVRLARSEFPDVEASAILDCGDGPGLVLGALRRGVKRLRFTGPSDAAAKLADIASQLGAELVLGNVTTLDLRDTSDPIGACRSFLTGAHV